MTTDNRKYLPYGRQYLDEDDIQAVTDVLRGDWLTTGPAVVAFEDKFRDIVGSDFAVSCSSGTAALHLAYMALGLMAGDTVIVPSISFVATANAAEFCGANVLFTDVDSDTGLMRAQDVLTLIAGLSPTQLQSVVAITPVNLGGDVAELDAINRIAQQYGWRMIIDSCHALGTTYRDDNGDSHTVGDCHLADMEVFSFHPVKTIAMGEGGALTTNDPVLYDKLCLLRNHGLEREPDKWVNEPTSDSPPPWYYEMQTLGYNYRQSDIHCALGISQLGKLPAFMGHRQKLVAQYDDIIAGLSPFITLIKPVENCVATNHLYRVLIDFDRFGMTRADFMWALSARHVGTQVHYIPIHSQPYYLAKYGAISRPGAEDYYQRTLSLPLHMSLSEEDVTYVVDQIADILSQQATEKGQTPKVPSAGQGGA